MTLVADLQAALGDDGVLEEPFDLHLFSKDASLMRGMPNCPPLMTARRGNMAGFPRLYELSNTFPPMR